MSHKATYHLSARQILLIAFASALMAVGTAACLNNFGGIFHVKDSANVALAEEAPKGITDPSAVTDEQKQH